MSTTNPDIEAERSVLGGILVDCGPLPPGLDLLAPGDFSDSRHAAVFAAMLSLDARKEPIDSITVARELGGGEWTTLVDALSLGEATSANVGHYAGLVRRDARRRDCVRIMGLAITKCKTPGVDGDEVLSQAVTDLGRLAEQRALTRPAVLRDLVREEIKAIEERNKNGAPAGVRTGFAAIDNMLGGLQAGGLAVIAARPSMGKSALATSILTNIALRDGVGALLFSFEMTREEQVQRMLASEARINLNHIRSGQMASHEWDPLSNASNRLFTDKIAIVDTPGMSISEMRSVARVYAARQSLGVIAVDYMQLMVGEGETREQEVASISRGLKALAMELRVPVIALSQLNRGVEQRSDKRPLLSDLRESGSIEQDAHQVMMIYRDDYYNPNSSEPGVAEIGISKNRNGPTGMVKLRWVGKSTRFETAEAGWERNAPPPTHTEGRSNAA